MKRYHKMTRNERIEDSDKVAIMQLEEELRKQIKQPAIRDLVISWVRTKSDIRKIVEEWVRKKVDIKKIVDEWVKFKHEK